MTVAPTRVVSITFALSLLGAICGAVLGSLTAVTHPPLAFIPRDDVTRFVLFGLEFGAFGGGVIGAVLAPIIAWIFLRRVPLDRAIRITALGIAAGVTGGLFFPLGIAIALGLVGFMAASGGLWWASRRRVPIANPPYNER